MLPLVRRIPSAWIAFTLALIIYSLAAGPTLTRQSIAPHYVYLADAMLHGRLDLVQTPTTYDLLVVDGRAYVAGSPMPAILLMPFVAVLGVGVSDILFGIVVGALNTALVHDLAGRLEMLSARIPVEDTRSTAETLRADATARTRWPSSHTWWLTLLFAFGTPHLYLATLGSVWFNAHVVAIFFGLLAVREALGQSGDFRRPVLGERRWFVAGAWLACAGFARPTMLFGSLFCVVLIWLTHDRRDRIRSLASLAAAIGLGIAAHGLYNAARFGSPTDFGYQYTAGAPNITSTYARYGGFNPRFLPCNLFVSILNPPEVNGYVPPITYDVCSYLLDGVNLSDTSAFIAPNPLGMSLFLVTPAFVLLFAARRRDPFSLAAWAALLATMIPLWMYHNTGSLQFGYRYWMDAAPMWLLLLSDVFARRGCVPQGGFALTPDFSPDAGPSGHRLDGSKTLRTLKGVPGLRTFARVLLLASIAINVWGFLWMFEKFVGVTWFEVMRGG